MREKYESLALLQLRELAKVRGIKGTSTMKKSELVEAMLAEDERLKKNEGETTREAVKETVKEGREPRESRGSDQIRTGRPNNKTVIVQNNPAQAGTSGTESAL